MHSFCKDDVNALVPRVDLAIANVLPHVCKQGQRLRHLIFCRDMRNLPTVCECIWMYMRWFFCFLLNIIYMYIIVENSSEVRRPTYGKLQKSTASVAYQTENSASNRQQTLFCRGISFCLVFVGTRLGYHPLKSVVEAQNTANSRIKQWFLNIAWLFFFLGFIFEFWLSPIVSNVPRNGVASIEKWWLAVPSRTMIHTPCQILCKSGKCMQQCWLAVPSRSAAGCGSKGLGGVETGSGTYLYQGRPSTSKRVSTRCFIGQFSGQPQCFLSRTCFCLHTEYSLLFSVSQQSVWPQNCWFCRHCAPTFKGLNYQMTGMQFAWPTMILKGGLFVLWSTERRDERDLISH